MGTGLLILTKINVGIKPQYTYIIVPGVLFILNNSLVLLTYIYSIFLYLKIIIKIRGGKSIKRCDQLNLYSMINIMDVFMLSVYRKPSHQLILCI